MFTYALDEYGDFEGLKNTNKPIYIGGVIYDDHSIRREEVIERKRIKAYYKSVISEAASIANCTSNFSYPEALHSNGDADRDRNVVRPVKEIVKSTLAEFIRRGTYKGNKLQYEDRNGTLRDFQDRNGEYYIFIILKSDQGMTRLLSQNANILAKDDYASNLYFHMADELISRLIFNNPLIDDIQEISLDIATRRSALLENNSRLFKEYKKQGYKAEQAEDGKYQFRLTNPDIYRTVIAKAILEAEQPNIKIINFNVKSIGYHEWNSKGMEFLYMSDSICSVLGFDIEGTSTDEWLRCIDERVKKLTGKSENLVFGYDEIDNIYSKAWARAALEILCKGLIKKNNVEQIKPQPKICKNCNMPIEDTVNLPPNLATMIDTCLKEGLFTNEDAAALIRKNGNDTLHANKGAQKLHVVNAKNIEKAGSCVQALYTLFKEVFGQELLVPDFDLNKVPFGYYEIVRAVPKAPNEVICGDNNYFVKDPQENYYYFQVFHRNSMEERDNELGARGVLTGNKIKEDKGRKSYLLDVHYPSNVLAESDREYIAYSVYSDSKLLSEIDHPKFTEREIVQIAIDLTNILIELQSIGQGISLRNNQAGNVIVTPCEGGYMAGIVNMETAKIQGYNATVYKSIESSFSENPYMPREVRQGNESENIQWEKADIYSVAKIMVYCKEPAEVKSEVDEDFIYDSFSEKVGDLLIDTFESSINMIDEPADFKEKLEDAVKNL